MSVYEKNGPQWEHVQELMRDLFQVELLDPQYLETSEIILEYRNRAVHRKRTREGQLDIATGGSGFLQVLLLLTFIQARPAR